MFMSCEKSIGDASGSVSASGSDAATSPTGTVSFSSSPNAACVGQPVTVTFDVSANCGKFNLELYDTKTSTWIAVTPDFLGSGGSGTLVFSPSADSVGACGYEFRINFAPGAGGPSQNCPGGTFNGGPITPGTNNEEGWCLAVQNCCTADLTIEGDVTDQVDLGNGWYEFEVTYTVTACKALTGVRTQGGLTAGGNDGSELISYSPMTGLTAEYPKQLNNNWVLSWTEDFAAGQTRTYKARFKRAFSACGKITGDWSSKTATPFAEAFEDELTACPE